jgi:hypothetical protein
MIEKIKMLFGLFRLAKQANGINVDELKSGWKTTEFWTKNMVQVIALAAGAWAIFGGVQLTPDQQIAIAKLTVEGIMGIEAAYMAVRSLLKSFHALRPQTPLPENSTSTVVATTTTEAVTPIVAVEIPK